ncbi:MAG: VWA domain-containing protein [Polyangiaceae bacterium]|nr:VWA domain-containing protein [Polyangiaceae bacterium]
MLALALPALVALEWAGLVAARWVRFERPALALPCALAVVVVAHRLRRIPGRPAGLRRLLHETMTLLAALAAALVTVGVELGRPLDRMAVIVVVDASRSVDLVPDAEARIRAELDVAELGMREDDRIAVLRFAAGAAVEDPLRGPTRLAPQRVEIGRDATDLAAGLRRALAEVPSDATARIVVLSDGVATRGDTTGAAAAAVSAGVKVDVIPLDQRRRPDVRVVAVRGPSRATAGEPLDLRVVTAASEEAEVEVRLLRDGELLRRGQARIAAGEDVLRLRELAPDAGLHRYEVQVSALDPARDHAAENNSGSTFVRVRGQAVALVLEGAPQMGAALGRALEGAAFRVEVRGAAGVPADLAELARFDVVTLSDIEAAALAPSQLEALASYVRDLGGGLLLLGGDRSLGPGGYGKTPIEEISPVSFDLKQDRRRASLAEVIGIDISGSMAARAGKHTKLELANEAAARSAALLGAGDRLGVLHVDTAVSWTVPLGPLTDKAAIERAIRRAGPGGGGIYVDVTLREAYAALAKETVNLKHMLLFADGSDAEERTDAFTLVSSAKARGITTSVVALGKGSDVPDLEKMSRLGGGRFYLVEDASRLPAVFAQETILAARSAIHETTFVPSPASALAATRGIDFARAPPLTGYVVTISKGRANVALTGPEGDPILASWSVGLGQCAAFTSDFKDRWGVAWTSWADGARMFGQLARELARQGDDPRVRLEAEATGGELAVRATVVDDDGRAESFRRLRVRIGGPGGVQHDVTLEAVGAGSYAATLPLSRPGAYVATAVDDQSGELVATTGAVLSAGEELRPTGTDRALLARVAHVTGGKVRDTLAGVFRERDGSRFAYRSVASWLTAVAAMLLLLSVAARRLAVPEALSALPARARARLQRRRERRTDERRRAAAATEEQLAEAKRTTDALLDARHASRKLRPPPAAPAPLPRTAPTAPPGPFARPSSPPPSRPPAGAPAPASPAPMAPGGRPLTAAEVLLARRRARKP